MSQILCKWQKERPICNITSEMRYIRSKVRPSSFFVRVIWVSGCRSVIQLLARFWLGHWVFYCFGASWCYWGIRAMGASYHIALCTYPYIEATNKHYTKRCQKCNVLALKIIQMFTGASFHDFHDFSTDSACPTPSHQLLFSWPGDNSTPWGTSKITPSPGCYLSEF